MSSVAILTRGDGGWGTGHLRRTGWLKTALALQDAVSGVAVLSVDSPRARELLVEGESDVRFFPAGWIDSCDPRLVSLAAEAELVIADWLASPPGLVAGLREAGCKTVLLDDYGDAREQADLVINSLLAELEPSSEDCGRAQVYSGVDYVQLPPRATKLRNVAGATARAMATELSGPPPEPGPAQAVMVSFGGQGQPQLIGLVLDSLAAAGFSGQVVVMPAPEPAIYSAGPNVEFIPAGQEFHSLLAACDLAVCGGGLTLYEAAYLGVPALVIAIPAGVAGYERHQLDTARKLEAAGCCRGAGLAGEVTEAGLTALIRELLDHPRRRLEMADRGMQLLDGRGLMRTVELILGLL